MIARWAGLVAALAGSALAAPAGAVTFDLVVGQASGGSLVQAFRTGQPAPVLSFSAFEANFTGGVFVGTGDVTGDGVVDIVAGSGAGGGPLVRVFSGVDGAAERSFFAFEPAFLGGVRVAAGDVTGDGTADIVAGAGAGGGSLVRVFDGVSGDVARSFLAFDAGFDGGVRVATGDVNGDGSADLIVGAGSGATRVGVFDGRTLDPIASFIPFADGTDGVTLSVGRFAGIEALFVGAGGGGAPLVNIYRLSDLTLINSLLAFAPGFTGGVSVAGGTFGGVDALYAGTLSGAGDLAAFATDGRLATPVARFQPFGADYAGGLELAAAPVAAVPEPGAWAMLIAGVGILGGELRRKRGRAVGLA